MAQIQNSSTSTMAYYLLHAARADPLRRTGHRGAAARCYKKALGLAKSDIEHRYLERRLAEVTGR